MIFKEAEFKVKDGRSALLRSPDEKDAGELLQFIVKVSGETDFLMRYPEEFADFTIEREESILRRFIDDPNGIMITCFLEGKVAGNCQISFCSGMKDRPERLWQLPFYGSFGVLELQSQEVAAKQKVLLQNDKKIVFSTAPFL